MAVASGGGRGKSYLPRPSLLPSGWEVPQANNLLRVYLESCQSQGACPISGVCLLLLHRTRLRQALPVHLTTGRQLPQLLQLAQDHLVRWSAMEDTQQLRLALATDAAAAINPRLSAEQLLQAAQVRPSYMPAAPGSQVSSSQQAVVSVQQLGLLLAAAAEGQPLAEVAQGVAEVLSYYEAPTPTAEPSHSVGDSAAAQPGSSGLSHVRLAQLLAHKLDVLGTGLCLVGDVRAVFGRLLHLHRQHMRAGPGAGRPAPQILPGKHGHEQVSSREVEGLLQQLCPDAAPQHVYQVANTRIRDTYTYDLSRIYLGKRGLDALLPALAADATFHALILSQSGLDRSAIERLCSTLQGPAGQQLTQLDLSFNSVADRGGLALLRLLASRPGITHLNLEGTPLMRFRSRTHHHQLGPAECEGCADFRVALAANARLAQRRCHQLAQSLLEHEESVKATCYGLASGDAGMVAISALVAALRPAVLDRGFDSSCLEELLRDGMTTQAGANMVQTDELGSKLPCATHIMWPALRCLLVEQSCESSSASRIARAAAAISRHRTAAKALFYRLASTQREAAAAAAAAADGNAGDGSGAAEGDSAEGPTVPLEALVQALTALATEQSWAIAPDDLQALLQPTLPTDQQRAIGVLPGEHVPTDAPSAAIQWPMFIDRVMSVLAG